MFNDPIVEEIHQIREKIMEECDWDIDKFFEMIRESEKKHPERLISLDEFKKLHPKNFSENVS